MRLILLWIMTPWCRNILHTEVVKQTSNHSQLQGQKKKSNQNTTEHHGDTDWTDFIKCDRKLLTSFIGPKCDICWVIFYRFIIMLYSSCKVFLLVCSVSKLFLRQRLKQQKMYINDMVSMTQDMSKCLFRALKHLTFMQSDVPTYCSLC